MRTKKNYYLLSLLLIPTMFVIYQIGTNSTPEPGQLKQIQEKVTPVDGDSLPLEKVEKFNNEFVIFFSGNMTEPTTQKLFFDQHKNIIYLGEGNFPGVVVVKIEHDTERILNNLKGKDYIDLIIKNQEGLDCHSN